MTSSFASQAWQASLVTRKESYYKMPVLDRADKESRMRNAFFRLQDFLIKNKSQFYSSHLNMVAIKMSEIDRDIVYGKYRK